MFRSSEQLRLCLSIPTAYDGIAGSWARDYKPISARVPPSKHYWTGHIDGMSGYELITMDQGSTKIIVPTLGTGRFDTMVLV